MILEVSPAGMSTCTTRYLFPSSFMNLPFGEEEVKRFCIREDSIFQIGYCYYLGNDRPNSLSHLRKHIKQIENAEIRRKAGQLIVANHLLEEDWESAGENLNTIKGDDTFTETLRDFAEAGSALPQKSALLAGVLSSIVPGSGKMYTGQWLEGIYPLALVGLAGWRTYDSFRDTRFRSTGFWIYLSIGVYFHVANIYGSAVSAQNYNREQRNELLKRIKIAVSDGF